MSQPLATVGILSVGDMGLGIAKLLVANNYRVVTNASDRSPYTVKRAVSAAVGLLPTDAALVEASDYILCIVPPRDAVATARRIGLALDSTTRTQSHPLYYLDLNAISPLTTHEIVRELTLDGERASVRFLDGGIIGGPPSPKTSTGAIATAASATAVEWNKPSIPLSGPYLLHAAPVSGAHLASTLNATHVHDTLGSATGLKMCFAALSKGFTALALQSYTTAARLGVLPELQRHLDAFAPGTRQRAERGMVGACPKAYRWVAEMREIADTFEACGGFDGRDALRGEEREGVEKVEKAEEEGEERRSDKGGDLFRAVAQVYRFLADETELGKERIGERKRGTNAEDVAKAMGDEMRPRKRVRRASH